MLVDVDQGRHLVGEEVADGLAKECVLAWEVEVHGAEYLTPLLDCLRA